MDAHQSFCRGCEEALLPEEVSQQVLLCEAGSCLSTVTIKYLRRRTSYVMRNACIPSHMIPIWATSTTSFVLPNASFAVGAILNNQAEPHGEVWDARLAGIPPALTHARMKGTRGSPQRMLAQGCLHRQDIQGAP